MRKVRTPRLRRGLYPSLLLHIVCLFLLFIWGDHAAIHHVPKPIDVIMIEVPKGLGEFPGLGTSETGDDDSEDVADTTPTETKAPPRETEKLAELLERLEKVATTEAPLKAPETQPKKKQPVAKKQPKQQPVRRKLSEKDTLLAMANQLGRKGKKGENSPGWKEGTGAKPLRTIPVGAIMSRYKARVTARIQRQYIVPGQLKDLPANKRPKPSVRVRINASGHIIGKTWAKKSGNSTADGAAMRAVTRSSPLPVPPTEIRSEVLRQWFTVNF